LSYNVTVDIVIFWYPLYTDYMGFFLGCIVGIILKVGITWDIYYAFYGSLEAIGWD
jgi:hypothetical protein